jgi:hypothetical protein
LININVQTFPPIPATIRTINRFQRNLNTESEEAIYELARFVQKSAKLRAPRGHTGKLRKGIKVEKVNKKSIRIVSQSPYGRMQEFGYRPHQVPIMYFKGLKNIGLVNRMRAWASYKAPQLLDRKRRFITVSGYKPHIRPAIEEGVKRINALFNNAVKNAVNKSR